MTEWNAAEYEHISALQKVMADEALGLLDLKGSERVLDVGCGDGKITAEIAARVPRGSVLGIDPSAKMITFAQSHWATSQYPNLQFLVGDARHMSFHEEFDLVVSFNALHWVIEQDEALRSIRAAMRTGAAAQLRLVPAGSRKSLEDVIRETRQSPEWASYFPGFHPPYLHLEPKTYAAMAEKIGLKVERVKVTDKTWDFQSRSAFFAFASVTFVEWTQMLPEAERPTFINDVLDRYAAVAGDDHTFKFYQLDICLERVKD